MNVNNTLDEDIKEFGVYKIYKNKLVPAPEIQSIHDYTHGVMDIHHFIKARNYKNNREWYEKNGIKLKDCSVVLCNYEFGGNEGTLGVIGPTRMDYARVVSALEYLCEGMRPQLEGGGKEHGEE